MTRRGRIRWWTWEGSRGKAGGMNKISEMERRRKKNIWREVGGQFWKGGRIGAGVRVSADQDEGMWLVQQVLFHATERS